MVCERTAQEGKKKKPVKHVLDSKFLAIKNAKNMEVSQLNVKKKTYVGVCS